MKPTPPKSLMWEPTQATLDIGLGVLCGGKGTAPGCAHCVGAQRYQALCPGDILVPSNACEPRIMVQFDGSAHRTRGVGGAGAALLQVECSGLALLGLC